jgi:hypothetical protein
VDQAGTKRHHPSFSSKIICLGDRRNNAKYLSLRTQHSLIVSASFIQSAKLYATTTEAAHCIKIINAEEFLGEQIAEPKKKL